MLNGKIALVTGAGRGIGREIALELAKNGAFVIVNYNGSREHAEEVVKTITENGGEAVPFQCNVADFSETSAMIQEVIQKYGHLDILVNNAGITKDNLIMKMSEEEFDRVLETNLKGTFNTIRHASRQMVKQKSGKMINIASVSGVLGNAGQANYAASKAGVIGLTKTMARELAARGINVNAVAPGFINTEMTQVLSDAVKEQAVSQIPFRRFGEAKEVAKVVSFLASDAASYITGQVICVDGGMAM
ncbi:MAG: 3-oxoacyl-[acyl-carrier-protein] reductase [Eubacteriales bacterium]|nr:3-oxoacyl-[acyl-carrier-protein] reductase [Eubacteriales bacterium]